MTRNRFQLRLTALLGAASLYVAQEARAGNPPPLVCDAGGPYVVECNGHITSFALDGTGSSGATTFFWQTDYPNADFDDPHSPNPVLMMHWAAPCGPAYTIQLTVGNGARPAQCTTTVRVVDTTPPEIACPPDLKVYSGSPTDPCALGVPTVSDLGCAHPQVTYSDDVQYPSCRAERFSSVIRRTWHVEDCCCNSAECVQFIDVVMNSVGIDVLPGVCPNAVYRGRVGVTPIAILGTDSLDVTAIDWNTVRVYGENCTGGAVLPKDFHFADVAAPYLGGNDCGCNNLGGDGHLDLVLRFDKSQLAGALGLNNLRRGTSVRVFVTGHVCGGGDFVGSDCLLVR